MAGLDYGFFQPPAGPYARAGVSDGMDESGLNSLSIDVLGAVVASAGGAPLPQVVERLITRPLGLRDTGFVAKAPKRLATPYADGKPDSALVV